MAQLLQDDLEYNDPKNVLQREVEVRQRIREEKQREFREFWTKAKPSCFVINFDFINPDAALIYHDEVVKK